MKLRLIAGFLSLMVPAMVSAVEYNLTVDRVEIDTGDFVKEGIGYNGKSPGPVLRFKEGEKVTINVTNNLDEMTSIHWHGLILPFQQDGVPGISFPGIKPGETFTYEFPVVQAGTYWFHSHSGFQEPDGAFGAIVIEPEGREPFRYDREYVVQLTDKHPHSGDRIMRNLKMMPDYYNREQQTVGEFFEDAKQRGLMNTIKDRMAWGDMRMMKADVEDVQGFTGMINGKGPDQNWTGLFEPGERIRLRFINSSAMTYFDVRIPGLNMTVVQADGNNVQPVNVDEFRIGVAETYDVIVRPRDAQAYTIFAESMGRSGYARATLAPEEGMEAPVPTMREPARLTMADMGGMHGMDHGSMDHGAMGEMDHGNMTGMDHSAMSGMDHGSMEGMDHSSMQGMDHSAHGGMASGSQEANDPFYAPGSGIMPEAANGGKFLSYSDLKAQKPLYEDREPTREIELRLTGNMERYTWSINGVKYEDADPIVLQYGERVRFKFVNETMMTHPMHMHGMWSILDVGADGWNPVKHTVSVQPGTTVYMETEVDAPGQWAFHCHLSYHAAAGMFRKIVVEGGPESTQANTEEVTSEGGDV
ncbi:copper resistance system multicopper oxidase [Marinobacter qingdaonensis]|uniref:Copper resistance system multicopper oxidase n=1 Tax=Marinobacter qingdaonensis TaxID=3108486 RepID=A0ABU5P1Y9_9GAMM|nr:copper resistance system multicopper oxidase [Marinobacter sp. ASW11-75]MEA1082088.1 copper resistance system multicopper oxidase [Marinobacter sp. ASW11-75]